MWAIAALVCWILAFILKLIGESLGKIDLVILGLVFLAAHLIWAWTPWARRP